MIQLDTENADRNLTSLVTVLTHTPSASLPLRCQALVNLGDGTKNLDGTGGDFEVVVTVGGQTVQPSPQTLTFSTAVRASFFTAEFPVPAGAEVVVKVLSPNAGDTDVDVTAYLYDVIGSLTLGVTSAAVNDESASTTIFVTTLTEATNDHYNGGVLVFTSGALLGQARRISDYAGDTKTITLESALTEAPADEVTFIILGRIEA